MFKLILIFFTATSLSYGRSSKANCPIEFPKLELVAAKSKNGRIQAEKCIKLFPNDHISASERKCLLKLLAIEQKPDFCQCTPSYQTELYSLCVDRTLDLRKQAEKQWFEKIKKTLPDEAESSFEDLIRSYEHFVFATTKDSPEVDPIESRPTYGADVHAKYFESRLRKHVLESGISLLENRDRILAGKDELQHEDKMLNEAYSDLLEGLKIDGKVLPARDKPFREAQREWLKHRDAWVIFAKILWKGKASPERIAARVSQTITHDRTAWFRELERGNLD